MRGIRHRRKGVTTLALVLFIGFFGILPLGIFGFELARYTLMQAQLQSVSDAAALAGTAALASSPQGRTIAQQHQLAMDVAAITFAQNTILKTRFTEGGNLEVRRNSGYDGTAPVVYNAKMNITLYDQNGAVQATGSPTATVMRLQTMYTDKAIFASNIFPGGVIEVASAISDGGLPQLDLFLCFDISGSMDDESLVNFVRRQWGGASGVTYVRVGTPETKILTLCSPAKEGTGLNATQPQNLSFASYGPPSNNIPWIFSESINPAGNFLSGLRGNQYTYPAGSLPAPLPASATKYPLGSLVPEQGLPPGNFDPRSRLITNGNGLNPNVYANGFTDMVMCNALGGSSGGYSFANVETCVEASRGNLESSAILLQSQGGASVNPALPSPQAGYYAEYWKQVRQKAQPISDARAAAENFFRIMNTSSNAHFGVSTFADTAGTAPGTLYTGVSQNADSNWALAGTGSFPVPGIPLVQGASNFQEAIDAVQGDGSRLPLGATGKTNISDSMTFALNNLTNTSLARKKAKKAVILFTDGVPNRPSDEGTAKAAARTQALRAKNASIPVYTIGLSQNPAIGTDQDLLLNATNQNPSNGGIAGISQNNAIYVRVNNSASLNSAFQSIARSLVVLQQ